MYIADAYNHRVRKVTVSTGIITTIAGTGASSYSGDNGAATSAELYYPVGVAIDPAGTQNSILCIHLISYICCAIYSPVGNVYIADTTNQRIRKVTILGLIQY